MSPCFWVILCPINFVGKIRDAVGDMANKFAAQDGMEAGTDGQCSPHHQAHFEPSLIELVGTQ